MIVGCILPIEIHIKYYIHKEVIVLQWTIVSMEIIIYIWTDIDQCIINIQIICIYHQDMIEQNRDENIYNKHHVIVMDIPYFQRKIRDIFVVDTLGLLYFRLRKYQRNYMQNFGAIKYFPFYAAERYFIALDLLGLSEPPFFKSFAKVRNYINNRNTYMNM